MGCVQTDSGFCPEPLEDIQWVYTTETNGLWTSSGCALCDTSVAPENYADWANENASEAVSAENATPCLYVYPYERRNWESKEDCMEIACSEEPNVNDGVSKKHSKWRAIKDILGNPSAALEDPEHSHMRIGSLQNPTVQTEISETDSQQISATHQ